ncbi:MAG: thioredoxin [Pseudobdellovibrio sp.]
MGQNTVAVTDASFEQDVIKSGTIVLVDFWAEWCGPCRALAPKLEEIATEMGSKVKIVKMNVDENQQTPGQYGIRGIPALLLFKDGKQVGELVGNQPKDSITEFIKTHMT